MSGTGGELKDRLDAIRKALKTNRVDIEEEARRTEAGVNELKVIRPQLMISRKCKMCIYEFNEYRYPESRDQNSTKSQELPMKKDDHTPEALGRFFKGFLGTPQDERRQSRVSKGHFRRR